MKGKYFSALLLSFMTFSAQAFVEVDTHVFNPEQAVDFSSDMVSYDQKTQIMTASGHVELRQNGILFQTDKILYNQSQDMVHIPGRAMMILPDGNKTKVSDIYLYPKKSEMVTGGTETRFIDGSLLRADHVVHSPKISQLKQVSYTPCETCENQSPLWQLYATTAEQDDKDHLMRFWNAFLEIKEIPVLYFPYFQIADHTVKRKSGFLLPDIGSDSTMDTYIKAPFFMDVAENQNLILTPVISLTKNPMGIVDYQGVFRHGKLNFQGSLTRDDQDKSQGHIKTDFEYDLTQQWRLSGQFFRTISDTYFRRYKAIDIDDSLSFLTSDLKAEYYGDRLQSVIDFYHFQSLQEHTDSKTIPLILPMFQMTYTTQPFTEQGADFYTQVSGSFINDRTHFKSNRLSVEEGMRIPYKTQFGLVTEWNTTLRLDGYSIDSGNMGFGNLAKKNDSYFTGRFLPQTSVKVSYPLAKYSEQMTQIFEPVMMLILAPNGGEMSKIPNVDSTVFDYNDVNLFSDNRYAGYDRVETGTRLNYGIQWSMYSHKDLPTVQFLFGQSYRLRDKGELNDPMGYREHLSSYVGRLKLNYKYATLMYRFRLDEKSLSAQKNDIVLEVGNKPLRIGIDYLSQEGYTMSDKHFTSKKEYTLFGRSQLTKDLSLTGKYRYNLLKTQRGPLETSVVLRYDHDCATVELEGSKSYTKDRNYHGNTSVSMRFYLKTLGGIGQ